MPKQIRRDVYQEITDQIVAALEKGVAPWSCPWERGGGAGGRLPRNLSTGAPYQGLNIILLWSSAYTRGFSSAYWLTYKQAKAQGGQVRKGERGTTCIFYKTLTKTEDDGQGEDREVKIPMARAFTLFNLDQIDGIKAPDAAPAEAETGPGFDPLAAGEALLNRSGATIHEGSTEAFYNRLDDAVTLPARKRFSDAANFYATAAHELVHWTGAEHRLARKFGKRFGDQAYAFEELVAELGAAFVTAELGILGEVEGHASYLASWLKVLRSDKRAIFHAASKAAEAQRYLMELYERSEQSEAA